MDTTSNERFQALTANPELPHWLKAQLPAMMEAEPTAALAALKDAQGRLGSDRRFSDLHLDENTPYWLHRIMGGMLLDGRPRTDHWLHECVAVMERQAELTEGSTESAG